MKGKTDNRFDADGYEEEPKDISLALDLIDKRDTFMSLDEILARSKKEKITLNVDGDVVAKFREYAKRHGAKYQTLMNEALRGSVEVHLNKPEQP